MTLDTDSIALQTARWYILAESLCLPRHGPVCEDHKAQAKSLLRRIEARGLTLAPLSESRS